MKYPIFRKIYLPQRNADFAILETDHGFFQLFFGGMSVVNDPDLVHYDVVVTNKLGERITGFFTNGEDVYILLEDGSYFRHVLVLGEIMFDLVDKSVIHRHHFPNGFREIIFE